VLFGRLTPAKALAAAAAAAEATGKKRCALVPSMQLLQSDVDSKEHVVGHVIKMVLSIVCICCSNSIQMFRLSTPLGASPKGIITAARRALPLEGLKQWV